jgi:hypothetical protein
MTNGEQKVAPGKALAIRHRHACYAIRILD